MISIVINIVFESLKKMWPFFEKHEPFLVVEILNKFIRATALKVDFGRKRIEIARSVSLQHEFTGKDSLGGLVKKILKKFGKLDKYSIIVGAEPGLATTIHSTVVLVRDNPKAPIDESDLNNRIAQGIWKLLDRGRSQAAAKMKINDLDVLLSDVKVKGIKLDGHKVISPLGFKAKTVEIQFCHTFNSRFFAAQLKEVIPEDKLVLISENGATITDILSRTAQGNNFLFVELLEDSASVFFSDGSAISYLGSYNWGKQNLTEALAKYFYVSRPAAEKMFKLYIAREASLVFMHQIEKLLLPEFVKLTNFLDRPIHKFKPSLVYILSFFDLPEFVFKPQFRAGAEKKVRFSRVRTEALAEQFDFDIVGNELLASSGAFSPVAGFLGFYLSPRNDNINKIARRHARWLIS